MKPGSLRIVAFRGLRERVVHKFEPGHEDAFYDVYDALERTGYSIHAYEMTDKGWTEF
ncbi:hypothetical protein SEA_DEJAVU_107 [Microbacterium Phage DejaVu]|nr:hypothetical protein SEA_PHILLYPHILLY_104 [Microbacterium phage PhillyPhilly]WNM66239.1 hypothetical protein SEA_DEJAVU_107 [Microbacterium Phage DejaVu]